MRNTSRIEIGICVFFAKIRWTLVRTYNESESKKEENGIFFVIRSKSNLKIFPLFYPRKLSLRKNIFSFCHTLPIIHLSYHKLFSLETRARLIVTLVSRFITIVRNNITRVPKYVVLPSVQLIRLQRYDDCFPSRKSLFQTTRKRKQKLFRITTSTHMDEIAQDAQDSVLITRISVGRSESCCSASASR